MSYNLTNAITGGNITLNSAGITGLSGAATTISSAAVGGLSGINYAVQGALYYKANLAAVAVPLYDSASVGSVAGVVAAGLGFRPLVAQNTPAGYSPNIIYPGSACAFVFGLDLLGNLRVAQGKVVPYIPGVGGVSCPLPELPDWFTQFAFTTITLVSATPASWNFGASLWNAAGVTINAPVNCMTLPPVDPIAP